MLDGEGRSGQPHRPAPSHCQVNPWRMLAEGEQGRQAGGTCPGHGAMGKWQRPLLPDTVPAARPSSCSPCSTADSPRGCRNASQHLPWQGLGTGLSSDVFISAVNQSIKAQNSPVPRAVLCKLQLLLQTSAPHGLPPLRCPAQKYCCGQFCSLAAPASPGFYCILSVSA